MSMTRWARARITALGGVDPLRADVALRCGSSTSSTDPSRAAIAHQRSTSNGTSRMTTRSQQPAERRQSHSTTSTPVSSGPEVPARAKVPCRWRRRGATVRHVAGGPARHGSSSFPGAARHSRSAVARPLLASRLLGPPVRQRVMRWRPGQPSATRSELLASASANPSCPRRRRRRRRDQQTIHPPAPGQRPAHRRRPRGSRYRNKPSTLRDTVLSRCARCRWSAARAVGCPLAIAAAVGRLDKHRDVH